MTTGFTSVPCSPVSSRLFLGRKICGYSTFTLVPCPRVSQSNFRRSPRRRTRVCPLVAVTDRSVSGAIEVEAAEVAVREGLAEANESVRNAQTEEEVERVRVDFLGRKGRITAVLKMMGKVSKEDRPKLGSLVNNAKVELESLIEKRKEELIDERFRKQMEDEYIDVTMPGLPLTSQTAVHPINAVIDKTVDIFCDIGYELVDDPRLSREIETDYYCFEALNCPEGHPAREMQDTFYLDADKKTLLRTQTSSVQIRYMEENKPPFKIIAPGRVYRRDTIDATHSPTFHQIEILAVDKDLNLGKLRATVIHFLKNLFGEGTESRFRASYFPFTTPSMEVDLKFGDEWMEVLGCGMVDPNVLTNVGIDPDEWIGFAAGFGVERAAMYLYGISDIRELYNSDLRFLEQLPRG